jgi:hypothetical protein
MRMAFNSGSSKQGDAKRNKPRNEQGNSEQPDGQEDSNRWEYSIAGMDENFRLAAIDIYRRLRGRTVGTLICTVGGECVRIHMDCVDHR